MTLFGAFYGSVRLSRTACCATAAVIALLVPVAAGAANEFPFDRELILDAKRIGAVKRLPVLTVEPNGNAVIDLWCKTVPARVTIADNTIKIEAAPLSEELPSMMAPGQCSPERMQADHDLLAALAQVTDWRAQGAAIVLNGPTVLRFDGSSH